MEDAPSGLLSGHRAGARTLAVCTSHTRDEIIASGVNPDFIVNDLTKYENWAVLSRIGAMLTRTFDLGCL